MGFANLKVGWSGERGVERCEEEWGVCGDVLRGVSLPIVRQVGAGGALHAVRQAGVGRCGEMLGGARTRERSG